VCTHPSHRQRTQPRHLLRVQLFSSAENLSFFCVVVTVLYGCCAQIELEDTSLVSHGSHQNNACLALHNSQRSLAFSHTSQPRTHLHSHSHVHAHTCYSITRSATKLITVLGAVLVAVVVVNRVVNPRASLKEVPLSPTHRLAFLLGTPPPRTRSQTICGCFYLYVCVIESLDSRALE
jgi:hypothetical protein